MPGVTCTAPGWPLHAPLACDHALGVRRIGLCAVHFCTCTASFKLAATALPYCAGITLGSGKPNKEFVGKVTKAQVMEIAKKKLPDTNATQVQWVSGGHLCLYVRPTATSCPLFDFSLDSLYTGWVAGQPAPSSRL